MIVWVELLPRKNGLSPRSPSGSPTEPRSRHGVTAEPLRRVLDAFRHSVTADAEVAEAVKAAREDGHSWAAIAAMLGVSKQTAQARYGQPPRQLKDPNQVIDGLTEG